MQQACLVGGAGGRGKGHGNGNGSGRKKGIEYREKAQGRLRRLSATTNMKTTLNPI